MLTGRTRTLVLVRHAKAERPGADGVDRGPDADHARALTPRGRRDATALGQWLAGHVGRADLVLCSSAVRAVQTWQLAAEALREPPPTDVRDDLYLAEPGRVLQAVRAVPDVVRRLVVVGHEPTASSLSLALADDSSEEDAVSLLQEGFATSAAALLEVPGDWVALAPQGARLAAFAVPR